MRGTWPTSLAWRRRRPARSGRRPPAGCCTASRRGASRSPQTPRRRRLRSRVRPRPQPARAPEARQGSIRERRATPRRRGDTSSRCSRGRGADLKPAGQGGDDGGRLGQLRGAVHGAPDAQPDEDAATAPAASDGNRAGRQSDEQEYRPRRDVDELAAKNGGDVIGRPHLPLAVYGHTDGGVVARSVRRAVFGGRGALLLEVDRDGHDDWHGHAVEERRLVSHWRTASSAA